jgi:hypothetical protein
MAIAIKKPPQTVATEEANLFIQETIARDGCLRVPKLMGQMGRLGVNR